MFKGRWLHEGFQNGHSCLGYFPSVALNKLLGLGGVAAARTFTKFELRRLAALHCRRFRTGGVSLVEATAKTWVMLEDRATAHLEGLLLPLAQDGLG